MKPSQSVKKIRSLLDSFSEEDAAKGDYKAIQWKLGKDRVLLSVDHITLSNQLLRPQRTFQLSNAGQL